MASGLGERLLECLAGFHDVLAAPLAEGGTWRAVGSQATS
jgi:hypothetical protein